jgi:predicted Zn-ribbon and HTH transcriptional regulator
LAQPPQLQSGTLNVSKHSHPIPSPINPYSHPQEQGMQTAASDSLLMFHDSHDAALQTGFGQLFDQSYQAQMLGTPMSPADSASPPWDGYDKPYRCTYPDCGKSFSKAHNLRSHVRIHAAVKPFKCQYCNYSFRRNHDLKRHTRLHTGVKPFKCNTCGKAFSRSDALKRHSRVDACGQPEHKSE